MVKDTLYYILSEDWGAYKFESWTKRYAKLRCARKPSPKIIMTKYLALILEQHHENETLLWLKEVALMALEEYISFSSVKVGVEVWEEDQTRKISWE